MFRFGPESVAILAQVLRRGTAVPRRRRPLRYFGSGCRLYLRKLLIWPISLRTASGLGGKMLKTYVCIQGKALSTNKSCFCFCKYGFGEDKYVSVIPRFFYCLFLYTKSTKRKNNKFSLYSPLLFAVGKRPKKKQLIY